MQGTWFGRSATTEGYEVLIAWYKVYLEGKVIGNPFLSYLYLLSFLCFMRGLAVVTGNNQTENHSSLLVSFFPMSVFCLFVSVFCFLLLLKVVEV